MVYKVSWEAESVEEATNELVLKKTGSFCRTTDQGRHIPDERDIGRRAGIMGYRVWLMG